MIAETEKYPQMTPEEVAVSIATANAHREEEWKGHRLFRRDLLEQFRRCAYKADGTIFDTWHEFASATYNIVSQSQAYRLVNSAAVEEVLEKLPGYEPLKEYPLRQLFSAHRNSWVQVYEEACELSGNRTPSGSHIESVARCLKVWRQTNITVNHDFLDINVKSARYDPETKKFTIRAQRGKAEVTLTLREINRLVKAAQGDSPIGESERL